VTASKEVGAIEKREGGGAKLRKRGGCRTKSVKISADGRKKDTDPEEVLRGNQGAGSTAELLLRLVEGGAEKT